jgi:hypothetical protein
MSETRYRFNTYCYCFLCGEHWENDLEAHECRVDAPESLTSPRTERVLFPISPSESPYELCRHPDCWINANGACDLCLNRVDAPESLLSPRAERDTFPISPSESPYEYVEALRKAQDGKCSCGKCERSANVIEARENIDAAAKRIGEAKRQWRITQRLTTGLYGTSPQ